MNNFTNSFWAQILAVFKKKLLQFTCYITGILRKSHFEISEEKLKKCSLFQELFKIQENFEILTFFAISSLIIDWITSFWGHKIQNFVTFHVILKKKFIISFFYKLELFMWIIKYKCPATFAQQCTYIYCEIKKISSNQENFLTQKSVFIDCLYQINVSLTLIALIPYAEKNSLGNCTQLLSNIGIVDKLKIIIYCREENR